MAVVRLCTTTSRSPLLLLFTKRTDPSASAPPHECWEIVSKKNKSSGLSEESRPCLAKETYYGGNRDLLWRPLTSPVPAPPYPIQLKQSARYSSSSPACTEVLPTVELRGQLHRSSRPRCTTLHTMQGVIKRATFPPPQPRDHRFLLLLFRSGSCIAISGDSFAR